MHPVSRVWWTAVVAALVLTVSVKLGEAFSLQDVTDFLFGSSSAASSSSDGTKAHKKGGRAKPKPPHAPGVQVNDFSDMDLPKVRLGGRVVDLVHGLHFDSILQVTPDELRPPSVVVFYDSSDAQCMSDFVKLKWDETAETKLPARERLFTARYDMHAAPVRAWYKFTPEMDLKKRFKVTQCPQVVYAHRDCSGFTEWCSRGPDPEDPNVELIGCENFVEKCTSTTKWDGSGSLVQWIRDLVDADGEPQISPFLRTYEEQGVWMRQREYTTSNTMMRNTYLSQAFPAFTPRGFKAMPVPKEMQDYLVEFLARSRRDGTIRQEGWSAESTQLSSHQELADFADLDREKRVKHAKANQYIKPLVEEWSQMDDLELTAFYGIRVYKPGHWLRNHIDRIDTHVLSVTIAVEKGDDDAEPWPLEVIDWNGDHVRYHHPAGTMVLYESSKLCHGRPYPLQGTTHAGAFIHYKPRAAAGSDAAHWEQIARDARKHQAKYTAHRSFRQSRSVEPEEPNFAAHSYGAGTSWTHLDADDDDEEEKKQVNQPEQFSVTFKNAADRPLDLYWKSAAGRVVHQGTLGKSANMEMQTFPLHQFFFAEVGSEEPIPGASFTMDKGRDIYKFALTRDGQKRAPSKYADKVREKLKQEEDE